MMDLGKYLCKAAASKWYWPLTGILSASVGTGVGLLVDMCTSEDVEGDTDGDRPDAVVEAVVKETGPSYLREAKVGEAFAKPDISTFNDYTKYFDMVKSPTKMVSVNGEPVREEAEEEQPNASVFEMITQDEFISATGNDDGYVTAAGTYFPDEGVLVGWNDSTEVKDPLTTIGEEAVHQFDEPDVGAVYVRNTHLKVLYEVVRGIGSYEGEE